MSAAPTTWPTSSSSSDHGAWSRSSGPGGVGKTRIATEIALRPDRIWRDGTWLVELGLDTGERAVSGAFQRTFGPRLGHAGGDDTLDWLTTGLATTELLIVLDNCEHVLAEAAAAVSAILRSCPGVSVLATSREPLGVSGECVRVLDPLELDDAMQLFASRAADSDGDFVLDDSSAASVATICANVDRLPLAIELTAARTRAFSPQQLAELLDHRFGLVSTANSGRPQRQQTMHAAVDWSFDLLFDDERRLLTRLSVFAGGFTLDAAATVCADDSLSATDIEVLLARLVDKSLVTTEKRSGATPRFRLLRPIADYAATRLDDAGETALMRTRHTQLADRSHGRAHRRPARQVDGQLGAPCQRRARQPRPGGRVGSRRGRSSRNAADRRQPQLVRVPQRQPAQRRAGAAAAVGARRRRPCGAEVPSADVVGIAQHRPHGAADLGDGRDRRRPYRGHRGRHTTFPGWDRRRHDHDRGHCLGTNCRRPMRCCWRRWPSAHSTSQPWALTPTCCVPSTTRPPVWRSPSATHGMPR